MLRRTLQGTEEKMSVQHKDFALKKEKDTVFQHPKSQHLVPRPSCLTASVFQRQES